jgi:PAS domain S-box-containing protein/excisionase family DNA binding protein
MSSTSRSLFDELPATTGGASTEPFQSAPEGLALWREAIERSDVAIVITSIEGKALGKILECNTSFVWMMGGSRETLIGTSWRELTAEDGRHADRALIERLIADGREIDQIEKRCSRHDGTTVWASVSIALLRDTERKPVAAACKLVDISPRKAYEAERDANPAYQEARAAARNAIRERIELLYEPVFDVESGHVVAIDAVGPCHPDRPELSPHRLVDIADDLDLGTELGLWMLACACSRLRQLASAVGEAARPRMIVHVPARLLRDDRLAEQVLAVIAGSGTAATEVTLEVGEHDLNDAPARVERELRALGRAGVRIYVGRLGRGVTSLSRLQSIPIDGLKLAGEIVEGMTSTRDARLVAALTSLGRAAEIEVIAEGVSSHAQLRALQELGCAAAKGPFLSGPVLGPDLTSTLERRPSMRLVQAAEEAPPPGHAEPGPTLPLGAAADALHISPSTLRRWADDGRIRSVRTVGGHRRIPVSEVHRCLESAEAPPRAELRNEPSIRSAEPVLADLLDRHGTGLAERVPRDMYAHTQGWFAQPAATADLHRWVAGVADAVRAGDQVLLTMACARLVERAATGGALLIETLKFVGLFFQAAEFALSRLDVAPEFVLDLRRVGAAARQSMLFAVDGHRQ